MTKIAIVGADSRKWAKIPDGERKAKDLINSILHDYLSNKFDYDKEAITLVSGHCPVGKEQQYCITCKRFLLDENDEPLGHEYHHLIEVYDQGGIDTWTEIITTELGLKKEIYAATIHQWDDKAVAIPTTLVMKGYNKHQVLKGFHSRNIQIAAACDVLYDIEPAGSCKYCNGLGFFRQQAITINEECPKCEGDGAYSGGTWTLKHARKLGREVHKVIIS